MPTRQSEADIGNILAGGPTQLAGGGGAVSATLSSNRTVAFSSDPNFLFFDGGASDRDVTLPSIGAIYEERRKGLFYFIANTGGSNSLVVKNAAAATIITIPFGRTGLVSNNGTTWYGAVL